MVSQLGSAIEPQGQTGQANDDPAALNMGGGEVEFGLKADPHPKKLPEYWSARSWGRFHPLNFPECRDIENKSCDTGALIKPEGDEMV